MIRKEAWSSYRAISGVRICWELEKPKGQGHQVNYINPSVDELHWIPVELRNYKVESSCARPRNPLQGYLAHKKHTPSLGPPYGPGHNPTAVSYDGVVSYERGTPEGDGAACHTADYGKLTVRSYSYLHPHICSAMVEIPHRPLLPSVPTARAERHKP